MKKFWTFLKGNAFAFINIFILVYAYVVIYNFSEIKSTPVGLWLFAIAAYAMYELFIRKD